MSHKSYSRMSRVNPLILEVVADTITTIDDPNLELVTITGCDVSADLRHAKVYFSTLGDESRKEIALEALQRHKGEIKRAMSRSLRMKFLPDLHFMPDPSVDEGWKIEEILKDIKTRKDGNKVRTDSLEDI